MNRALASLLLALAGCQCSGPAVDSQAPETDDTGDSITTEDTGDPWINECTEPAPLPVEATVLSGFPQAEDFALDARGYLVAIDWSGNMIGTNQMGDQRVILPNAGEWTSGMHQLPDGAFVYSDAATGTLMRVVEGQGAEALVSGMSYPNGIEVDLEGFVYVSEHDAGRIRRIDPETGDYEIIADGLFNPNGLQFSTDYATLYVNSFGGGMLHAVERESEQVWAEPQLLGYVPSIDPTSVPTPCVDAQEGDSCIQVFGGLGVCTEATDGELACETSLDETACAGLAEGDPCETDFGGELVESVCVMDDAISEALFCPRTEAGRVEACVDKTVYANCRVDGAWGYCENSWEGPLICSLDTDYNIMGDACDGLAEGDACEALYPASPWEGVCDYDNHWGLGMICAPWYGWGEKGGLDGMAVDACDKVYVTEYIAGIVYRFDPAAAEPAFEVVYETGSSWIPNMHWGNGIGGWEENVLYVLERDRGHVYGLQVDVLGVVEAYLPGVSDVD